MSVLSQESILNNEETLTRSVAMDWPEQFREKLLFSRGALALLKETNLFGPIIDTVVDDMDFLIQKMDELTETRSLEIRITVKAAVPIKTVLKI